MSSKSRRAASGTGTIRKITVTKDGKNYTYWQARYTAGYDPGSGKQIQRTITGKTQKDVSLKLRQLTSELDQGTYIAPNKLTVMSWMTTWHPETRFHDLRHTYAVAAIKSGDDIKTVQENLGHATAAFTLDVYGHVTSQMKQASASRMEQFISAVSS